MIYTFNSEKMFLVQTLSEKNTNNFFFQMTNGLNLFLDITHNFIHDSLIQYNNKKKKVRVKISYMKFNLSCVQINSKLM